MRPPAGAVCAALLLVAVGAHAASERPASVPPASERPAGEKPASEGVAGEPAATAGAAERPASEGFAGEGAASEGAGEEAASARPTGEDPEAAAAAGVAPARESPNAGSVLERSRAVLSTVRDKSMQVTMRVRSPTGDERVRRLRGYEKHDPEARKVLWIFESPKELEGTGFLAWQNEGRPDSLWVYFPGQRRVRRVPPSIRRENFQGSMFTYEDLVAVFFLDFAGTDRLAGEAECGRSRCWIVETTLPEDEFAYRRLRTWIDRETLLPSRVEFYGDELLKTMQVTRTEVVAGIPSIVEVEMHSPSDGYRTVVELAQIDYNRGLADNLFTIEHLSQMGD